MALFVVATPIGNWSDLTLRAVEVLKSADLVIGEEKREVELLLKRAGAFPKPYELLNEHSKPQDLKSLVESCRKLNVALVSDCGTPAFCDPGADLVKLCRKAGVSIKALPGASSLMTLLSVAGQRLDEFYFAGFLPRETAERDSKLKQLLNLKVPFVIMDTPYRLKKLLEELSLQAPQRSLILGCDLTQDFEQIYEGSASQILKNLKTEKSEFVLIVT